jgi:hypothetical protein
MLLEITDSERQFLTEVVENASKEMLHEIDHTDSREYKKRLQDRMRILEQLARKIQEPQGAQKTQVF